MTRTASTGEWTPAISSENGVYTLEPTDGELYIEFQPSPPEEADTGVRLRSGDQTLLDAAEFETAWVRPANNSDVQFRTTAGAIQKLPQIRSEVDNATGNLNVDVAEQSVGNFTVDLEQQSVAALTVTDDGSFNVAGDIDVSNRSGRDVGKFRLMDSTGTLVDFGPYHDRVTATATYATINPGPYADTATIVADTSGSATLTIEVSNDGATWDAYTVSIGGPEGAKETVVGYAHVRAAVDQNLNAVQISAKGV